MKTKLCAFVLQATCSRVSIANIITAVEDEPCFRALVGNMLQMTDTASRTVHANDRTDGYAHQSASLLQNQFVRGDMKNNQATWQVQVNQVQRID